MSEDRMTKQEAAFAVLLAVAAAAVVVGVAALSTPAAWVVAGVLLAGWSWLILGDVE